MFSRRLLEIWLGLCLVSLGSATRAADPPAGDDPESGLEIEEIVVTGTAEQTVGPSVKQVERAQIERQGAQTLSDVLATQPALQSVTGARGERTIMLRGFDQRQTLLLVDSVPFLIPYDGQVDLNVIPAELIDHVTVVKGPGSVLFGPTGLGGAINVVTRRPGEGSPLRLGVEMSGVGGLDLRAVSSLKAGPVGLLLGGAAAVSPGFRLPASFKAQAMEDGGLRDNSDRSTANAFGNLRIDLTPDQRLTVGGFYLHAIKGIPPSTLPSQARFWRFTDWSAAGVSVGHEARFDWGLRTDEVFFARWYDNLIDSYDDASYTTQTLPSRAFHSWYHDRMIGGRLRARHKIDQTPWGETLLRLWSGAQVDSHFEDWSTGDKTLIERALLTVAPEAEALLADRLTLTLSAQGEFEFPIDMPKTQATNQSKVNPVVSIGYQPLPELSLLASVARRSRYPTLKERFSSFLGQSQPNPSLGPEDAWHLGLDATWEVSRQLALQAAIYDAEVDGLIDRAVIPGGLTQMQNLGVSRLLGAELALTAKLSRFLTVSGGYVYLYARRTDLDSPNDRLPDRPAHKLTAELILAPTDRLELSTLFLLAGPIPFQHPETGLWGTLGVYTQWNARIAFAINRGSKVWLRASNLLDASYQTKFGFPEPGFEIYAGFQVGN